MPARNALIVFFLLFSNFTFANNNAFFSSPSEYIVTIKSQNYRKDMLWIREMSLDLAGVDLKEGLIDLVVNKDELSLLEERGLNPQINFVLGISKALDERYYSPQEIEDYVQLIASEFPHIAKAEVIGRSVQGRKIWALKISDNVAIHEANEPAILFNSMHHAREVMTPEVSVDMIDFLTKNYERDPQVTRWIDNNEIWIVPMLNVDGNNRVWEGQTMWRKNLGQNGRGVDLNRNYPYKWGACRGSSGFPFSETYRGPKAASEPETQALMELVKKVRPVFDISYHSYSQLVIYPFGCQGERSSLNIIESIGKDLATEVNYTPGTPWELLYAVDGDDIDWMHAEYQVMAYTLEVNSRREGFHPDYEQWREKTVIRNRPGWQYLLNRLDGPGIRGLVSDEGEHTIEVFSDGQHVQTYRVNPDRSYHLILNSGSYTLKFTKDGQVVSTRDVEIAQKRIDFYP